MSCETNFHAYCERVAGAGSAVAAAFGGDPWQAQAVLQQIFQVARNQEPPGASEGMAARLAELQAQAQRRQAEDDTRRLFDDIRAAGLQPPTHSPTGLPKPDAQRGYAAVYQTVRAIANGTVLPVLAQQVAQTIRGPLVASRAALAQTQHAPVGVPLAQAQPAPPIIPGSPAFFAPLLEDVGKAVETTRGLPQKLTPVIAGHCQRAMQAAPSLIDLANGHHAYGTGPAYQVERQALIHGCDGSLRCRVRAWIRRVQLQERMDQAAGGASGAGDGLGDGPLCGCRDTTLSDLWGVHGQSASLPTNTPRRSVESGHRPPRACQGPIAGGSGQWRAHLPERRVSP